MLGLRMRKSHEDQTLLHPKDSCEMTAFTKHIWANFCKILLTVWLWRFCLVKYAQNGPLNERIHICIPGLILPIKIMKVGTNVGLNMVMNICSWFYHNHKNRLSWLRQLFVSSMAITLFPVFSWFVGAFWCLASCGYAFHTCWSTFWKSTFEQQLGCRFDTMDSISSFFVFQHMQ